MTQNFNQKLGARLRELREEHGLSVRECAKIMHICANTCRKYERGEGEACVKNVLPLLNFYGISMNELLKGIVDF